MASLRGDFQHFYPPDEDETAMALRTGLITVDSNVLLSLYRFRVEARDDPFRVLERLGDRLWIPYQVGLEFHRNRLSVIAAQENYFSTTRNELTTAVNTYVEKLRSFSGRIAFQEHGQRLEGAIRHAHGMVIDEIRKAETDKRST